MLRGGGGVKNFSRRPKGKKGGGKKAGKRPSSWGVGEGGWGKRAYKLGGSIWGRMIKTILQSRVRWSVESPWILNQKWEEGKEEKGLTKKQKNLNRGKNPRPKSPRNQLHKELGFSSLPTPTRKRNQELTLVGGTAFFEKKDVGLATLGGQKETGKSINRTREGCASIGFRGGGGGNLSTRVAKEFCFPSF